ncbi:MAG: alkaline phosphatase [Caldilineaceae bacterium]|nr:alkaline phosphatase [Caldilineaceae bacterium]MBP8106099.1 alkaline phosphatase [Caldilineaceae bacterium]MBP8123878.1 alkaline phosphatase [Caldilineaceae bacterium]MBP9073948.1 alkaline phosphatase [Caldilineaceae bacterium]
MDPFTRIAQLSLVFLALGLCFWPDPVSASPAAPPAACYTWTQVNEGGFGIGVGTGAEPFASEEGFEVAVYADHLYVGMEADNTLGARLWRTVNGSPDDQDDWQEVIAIDGKPFGHANITQNDHIDSLAGFNGYLYASTANGGTSTYGTQVWRSATGDPNSWTQVNTDGFGTIYNVNFKDMQVFDNHLCGGTVNASGTQVWCTSNGTDWAQKNVGGFGTTANGGTYSGLVFKDALYFGTGGWTSTDVASLYRTLDLDADRPEWTQVFEGPVGSIRVDILGELNDYIYISHVSPNGMVILRSPTGNPDSWTQVNIPSMDGDKRNSGTIVDGGTTFDGHIYVGVYNTTTGVEVWRTDGTLIPNSTILRWEQVGGSGLGNRNTWYAELIPFNGDLYAWTSNYITGQEVRRLTPDPTCPTAKYVILMIADGWGYKPIEAANLYSGNTPIYQSWTRYAMSTFPLGGSYDPTSAWATFSTIQSGSTDSAAAATALYTGIKTANGRISVDSDGNRLYAITEKARLQSKAVGAVTTVQISHATPGAWEAHNDARGNGYAIGDEGLWGNPATTGASTDTGYGGAHGPTLPGLDVIIGGGHPTWPNVYVSLAMRSKLVTEDASHSFAFVERLAGFEDGGTRLQTAALDSKVTRLVGLFGGADGQIDYRLANNLGHNPENPTLAQMTTAALTVLERDYQGFTLMIEGGAVDWAAHANNLDQTIGEMIGFNEAVQTVINWVEDTTTPATWDNTLVIVTGDHETGYLTAGPGIFPNVALLGPINADTLALEKIVTSTDLRASWSDTNSNNEIDSGETVYWAWNSGSHVNSLIPLYVKGAGADLFAPYATGSDTVRGPYLDNTDVFKVMDAVLPMPPAQVSAPTIQRSGTDIVLTWPAITTDVDGQPLTSTGYQIHSSTSPYFRPSAATLLATATDPTYTHTGAAGTGLHFYTILPIAGPNRIGPASTVLGIFTFSLTPGE